MEQPVEENLKVLQGLHRVVSGLRYDGAEVELHAAMYLRVRDGHITGIEEYLDSGQRAAIRSAREALS